MSNTFLCKLKMALPELISPLVETKLTAFCDNTIPVELRDKVRLSFSVRSNTVTLFQGTPGLKTFDKWTKKPIAQFRLNVVDHLWRLYFASLDSKAGWVLYPDADPTKDFEALLLAVEQNKAANFYGLATFFSGSLTCSAASHLGSESNFSPKASARALSIAISLSTSSQS